MIYRQRSPVWPYLLVLSGLFVLSLAVSKDWQTDSDHPETRLYQRDRAQARLRAAASAVAIVHPSPDNGAAALPMLPLPSNRAEDTVSGGASESLSFVGWAPGASLIEPLRETVAKKIADLRRFGDNFTPQQIIGSSAASDDSQAGENNPSAGIPTSAANWPLPSGLLTQLDRLAQQPQCGDWAIEVGNLCLDLCQTAPGDSQTAVLTRLQTLAAQAETMDSGLKAPATAAQFRRVRYTLQRHLALWSAAAKAERSTTVYADLPSKDQQRKQLEKALADAQKSIASIPNADAWQKYLSLSDLEPLAAQDSSVSDEQAQRIARSMLARLLPAQATDGQRRVLEQPTLRTLADQLRQWAGETVDVRDVLARVEQYETTGLPSDGHLVVAAMRKLDWCSKEPDRDLANQLDQHYRNANLRIALSSDFFNRMAPDQPTTNGVVSDNILGAAVSGSSTTNSKLSVKLIPDPQRLHFWIDAQGTVDSQTHSTSGSATFDHDGRATFLVHEAVVVDRQGLWIANPAAEADSSSQLTGMRTSYDGWPIIGSIFRNIARSQHDSMQGAAQQETDAKVATEADRTVAAEVKPRLEEADQAVRKNMLNPLVKLGVAPEPISLETTLQRLTMRLRIAGQNQLGGNTARPQALSDSVVSFQMHESALNNILDQLQLAGCTFTLPELYRHVAQRLSWSNSDPPDNLPTDATIRFAPNDPVRVRYQNGAARLTLAVSELNTHGRTWQNFLVTLNYQPEIEDLHVRLVRQGPVELVGGDYDDDSQQMLRGLFSKLLPPQRKFELIPIVIADNRKLGDMCVTQCVVEDGWLALSIGPDRDDSLRSASLPSVMTNKTAVR
jgi:hypothetical protein